MTHLYPDDARAKALRAWIVTIVPDIDSIVPASADASFRRYFRLIDRAGNTSILMDAPPEKEDSKPFVDVAKLFVRADVIVPTIREANLADGFLWLSDLGRETFLDVFPKRSSKAIAELMRHARTALIRWQQLEHDTPLPKYDAALLQRELDLFPEWYVNKHLKKELTNEQRASWQSTCAMLIERALAQAQVNVHRDYMPRNLMATVTADGERPGVLDFQDAVRGPISYDIISMYRDAFWSWEEETVLDGIVRYWDEGKKAGLALPAQFGEFYHDCEWMGLQRHLKVMGIFARICYRDGKPKYLADTPRFETYVNGVVNRYEALSPLKRLFAQLHETPPPKVGYTF